jgi:hypothetical protein
MYIKGHYEEWLKIFVDHYEGIQEICNDAHAVNIMMHIVIGLYVNDCFNHKLGDINSVRMNLHNQVDQNIDILHKVFLEKEGTLNKNIDNYFEKLSKGKIN